VEVLLRLLCGRCRQCCFSVPPVVVVVVVAVAVAPFTSVVVVVVADAAPSVDWTGSTFDTLSVSFPTVAT